MFSFLEGSLAGVHRLSHLAWLRGDAIRLKFLRLPRWPVRKVFSAALVGLSDSGVERLVALIAQLGLAGVQGRDCAVLELFRVARQALGMGKLIGHALRANEAAFLLRLLAFNAAQRSRAAALERAGQEHRPTLTMGLITRQRRFYQGAGRRLRCRGRWVDRVRQDPMVERMWRFDATQLIGTG